MPGYEEKILELMDRVSVLERKVFTLEVELSTLKDSIGEDGGLELSLKGSSPLARRGRDKTKYLLNHIKYGKNRVVLAIVQEYVKQHPEVTAEDLKGIFREDLQGSLGVVQIFEEVKVTYKGREDEYKKRFFCEEGDIVPTKTDDCVVCSQWHVGNIGNLIARAKELGIDVTEI